VKDRIAVVGVGATPYLRDAQQTPAALALAAATAAIRDAGLTAEDIDGVVGTNVHPHVMQEGLRLPGITWWASPPPPFSLAFIEGAAAIAAGLCKTVLAYQGRTTHPAKSRAAARDPMRRRAYGSDSAGFQTMVSPSSNPEYDSLYGAVGYAAWAGRYLHEFGVGREVLGLMAINSRSNAARNDHAVITAPMSMDDYLEARMIREPFGMLDMEIPVDAGDALVLTSTERARDLPRRPVLIHAATLGQTGRPREDQTEGLDRMGQTVVAAALAARSDIPLTGTDVIFPYDGFSYLAVSWLESVGYCARGEAYDFMVSNWDKEESRLKIGGRVLANPHGGSLSEGGTQGAGHLREAVVQLRGHAGGRQVAGASTALVTPGGFFFNATGVVLRTE
jgi:acetyl-CoA acetyltransferase